MSSILKKIKLSEKKSSFRIKWSQNWTWISIVECSYPVFDSDIHESATWFWLWNVNVQRASFTWLDSSNDTIFCVFKLLTSWPCHLILSIVSKLWYKFVYSLSEGVIQLLIIFDSFEDEGFSFVIGIDVALNDSESGRSDKRLGVSRKSSLL